MYMYYLKPVLLIYIESYLSQAHLSYLTGQPFISVLSILSYAFLSYLS